jgi:hypothetical protein
VLRKRAIGRDISTSSGEYNLCLDVEMSLPMALFLNTHTFSPMLLMKSIHNLTWKAKVKLSQAQSSTEFFIHKPT